MIHIFELFDLNVGDKITKVPKSFGTCEDYNFKRGKVTETMRVKKSYTGTVVYIHPEKRFYVVEYVFEKWGGGTETIRESYKFDTPTEDTEYQHERALLTKYSKIKSKK